MDENVRGFQATALPEITDEARIAGDVVRAVLSTGRFSSSQLRVSVADGVVTLRGRVTSYHQKQAAQVAALAVRGISQLRNEVEVT